MPAIYLLMLESFNSYPVYFFKEFVPERPSVVMFDLILFYILFALVFFLVKKSWICLTFFSVLTISVSLTNYIKYALTGENFFPHDIVMAGNMNELVEFVSVDFAWWMWAFFAVMILSALILGVFSKDAPFRFYIRVPVSIVLSVLIILFFGNGDIAGHVFNKFKMEYESTAIQYSNYRENGFVGAFAINIAAFSIQKPEGYSDAVFESELNKYAKFLPSDDFNKPDIIVILSESFWDPRLLPESMISPDPFKNFDEISRRENAHSGGLIVPAYGGGTIRTEFEVLTGLSCDALPSGVIPYNIIKSDVPSYVSYYKNLGYNAIAIHPYLAKFYSRNICLPRIGFDEYHAETLGEIIDVKPIYRGGYTSDESFVEYLKYFLDKTKKDEPLFLFGITMENHQRYRDKYENEKFTVSAYNAKLNSGDQNNFENYTQGVKNADEALGMLCDFIDKRERPTVLVYFGDHLPSICTNLSAYRDTGFIDDSPEAIKKLYTTPFLIYSNFALNKDAANYDTVASYDLLNVLSSVIGAGKSDYMSYLDSLREVLPYYNRRLDVMNILTTDEQKEMLKLQYYATYKAMKR